MRVQKQTVKVSGDLDTAKQAQALRRRRDSGVRPSSAAKWHSGCGCLPAIVSAH